MFAMTQCKHGMGGGIRRNQDRRAGIAWPTEAMVAGLRGMKFE